MGILNGIEGAFGAAVDGAKELLGQEKTVENQPADTNESAAGEINEASLGAAGGQTATETNQLYTVQAGDTLSKISKEFYGDSHSYMRIFEANRDTLDNPDDIKIGQELVIPGA